ncbi:TadG family pilus assembly protein [Sphingopyxis sp. JAI128]|uniref:TadG family pilus assembly protein n=1 Tax=Sphingopyxis sp. JAI128 TaxID=2723066 RepID=UPI001620DA74|nr:TadG family pilus assembly protein [Sphingopyxis sp. JAI128]MBB6424508.1 putative membrane protein [Sphingopyxis sp. JAI128]
MAKAFPLRRLIGNRHAGVSISVAFGMTMLIGSAALAVDVGSLYLDRRKLQGIADAAALSAAARPGEERAAAERIIAANCDCDIRISALTPGTYVADPGIPAEQRFAEGGASPNAVRIVVTRNRPLFFGSFLTGRNDTLIRATATGARRGYAAFSLGSRVAAVNGGLPNALLSGLTGSQLSLSLMDYNALASTDIDLLAFSDALRTEIGADVLTFGQTLDTQVTLPQVVSALARASDGRTASALEHIADRALPRALLPSRAIDLGPRSSGIRVDAANPVKVNALGLLRTMLLLGNANRQVDLSVESNLPGGSGIDIALMIGEPPANAPLIAVTDTNDVVVRTAQVRLMLDTRIATPLASIHLPVLAELGSASARISDIDCAPNSSAAVSLAVVTSPAKVALGTVAEADFQDMQRPLDPQRARVVKLPLVSVDAEAELVLSDLNEKQVDFSRSDIEDGKVKTVSSTGLVAGAAKSLADRMELRVNALGLGLDLKALTGVVGETVGLAAPAIDGVLSDLTGLLGVQIGQADSRINALRCGKAKLV